jgi:hypothetical protein
MPDEPTPPGTAPPRPTDAEKAATMWTVFGCMALVMVLVAAVMYAGDRLSATGKAEDAARTAHLASDRANHARVSGLMRAVGNTVDPFDADYPRTLFIRAPGPIGGPDARDLAASVRTGCGGGEWIVHVFDGTGKEQGSAASWGVE